jgi:hypothetical protein
MRKILVVLAAGLFVFSLAACGSSSNKAKTASSDSDSSDSSDTDSSDSSDSRSSTKSSSTKSSSSKSTSSSGGDTAAYCSKIQEIVKVFDELDTGGVPSDSEIDAIVAALQELQDAAPGEIEAEMTTFIDVEVAAASAAKAAADNSDAQESAANDVLDAAGDDFIQAATKVDQFTTDSCGFGLSGETTDSFSS